eukprot:TRINITY_DN27650_c0_g1_i1.p1 TRINITY_DN27650_c0_g1~~TRINITY_DN27650_c0_g1_i1.p1  ORF type:complete len:503 (+),score=133.59 TRINITY_DN27650_c0_g1_i1:85-1593(+)
MPTSPMPGVGRRSSSSTFGYSREPPLKAQSSFSLPPHLAERVPAVTYSMVSAGFMLGFVSMLVLSEVQRAAQARRGMRGPCPSVLEVRGLLADMGMAQYYDSFLDAGYDRLDVIASSHYLDMTDVVPGMRPYHWARIVAEATRLVTHRRVSVAALLRDEDLGLAPAAPPLSDPFEANQDPSEHFFNIAPGQYYPNAAVGDAVVTTLLSGPLPDRLGTLANAVQLANACRGTLHVIWVQDGHCGARWSSLFAVHSDKVSVSSLPFDLPLSHVFPAMQSLDAFDAVFTTASGVIADLLPAHDEAAASSHPFAERWLTNDGAAVSLDGESDVVGWAKERIGSELRVHILHKVDQLAAGVSSSAVNAGLKAFGVALSSGVTDKVRRTVTSNALEKLTAVAVYESEARHVDLPRGKTVLLLSSPAAEGAPGFELPEGADTLSLIRSTYNASAPHSEESTIVDLLSTAALIAGVPVEVLASDTQLAETEYRPVTKISAVLCPLGLACP